MHVDAFAHLFGSLSHVLPSFADGSHDLSHIKRVWKNAHAIATAEGGNLHLLAAAVILHDCVAVEKDSPLRAQAARLSAEKAAEALDVLRWAATDIDVVKDAIQSHSYSAGLTPQTQEGRILQDADRLDAIGMIGIARCFYTAGRMGSKLYHPLDPAGLNRVHNDKEFALDHFPCKLLHLYAGFRTKTGEKLASERHSKLKAFYDEFLDEISVD